MPHLEEELVQLGIRPGVARDLKQRPEEVVDEILEGVYLSGPLVHVTALYAEQCACTC
jgi:hypothetical protein